MSEGKTGSWLELANQFNILPDGSNKQKSDKVRKLYNQIDWDRVDIPKEVPYLANTINGYHTQWITNSTTNDLVLRAFDTQQKDWEEFKKWKLEKEGFQVKKEKRVDGIHILLSCVHVPYQNNTLISKLLSFINDNKSKIAGFHLIGDYLDLASLSKHDEGTIDLSGLTLGKEYEIGNQILDLFDNVLPKNIQKTFIYGNHCFSEDTELLTKDGWVNIDDATSDMEFASFNTETKEIVYSKPIGNIVRNNYVGLMHSYKSRKDDILVTPQHKMLYFGKNEKNTFNKSEDIKISDFSFYNASINNQTDYTISDDEIKLAGWIHSDGGITFKKDDEIGYTLYQSKLEGCIKIENILNSLNIQYVKNIRSRNITKIMFKDLVEKCLDSVEYRIKKGQYNLVHNKYELSDWIFKLSKRQFDIFLNSYIDGDGSRKKESSGCAMIYGQKEILEQIQNLCLLNGHSTSIYEYCTNSNKPQYRLNIDLDKLSSRINKKRNYSEVEYSGRVWCVTTSLGTVVSKRNYKISIQGNCDRYFRHISNVKNYKTADAIMSPTQALKLKERGYNVLENWKEDFITLGKYQIFHGIYCTANSTRTHLDKLRVSNIFGHTHRVGETFDGSLHSLNIGCFADIDSKGFKYLSRVERQGWKNAFGIVNIAGEYSQAELIICEDNGFFYNGKRY